MKFFSLDVQRGSSGRRVTTTAKQVQEAIKNGTATVGILQSEIARMESREERQQELDREKVQFVIYHQFKTALIQSGTLCKMTEADAAIARLLIYHSLDYSGREQITELIELDRYEDSHEEFYRKLSAMTDEQYCSMIRLAFVARSEAKNPRSIDGFALYQLASAAGLPVVEIEKAQQEKVTTRQSNLQKKKETIQKKIKKIEKESVDKEKVK